MTTTEQAPAGSPDTDDQPSWVTLREASEACGVSVSALRKAYRSGRIDSRDEHGPYGVQKRVRLDQVREVVGAGPRPQPRTDSTALVLLEEARRGWDAVAALHLAGQDLSAARERAGRAEGEARVYAELVDELRARVALLERELQQARGGAAAVAGGSTTSSSTRPPATSSVGADEPAGRGWFGRRRP